VADLETPDLPLLESGGCLLHGGVEWLRFLSRIGADSRHQHRFSARNFLLDEGIAPERVDSYAELGCMGDHGTIDPWLRLHEAYLKDKVFRLPPGSGLPTSVDRSDEISCPETFRFIDPASPFLSTDSKVHLIRVERLDFIARRSDVDIDRVKALAEAVAGPLEPKPIRELNLILKAWAQKIEVRPVFAAFLEDVRDLFEKDSEDWADALRDALGLAHLNPKGGAERGLDVLVFRYPVSDVPGFTGSDRRLRPLVPPTVLDGDFSPAFCPAPHGGLTGHTIDLSAKAKNPRREILHPSVSFQAKQLWKVGTLRRPVNPEDLPTARVLHLWMVRRLGRRDDYARGTDGDLL